MYEKVKHFYDIGLYTEEMVRQFVIKGKLTEEEYESITGEPWAERSTNNAD